MKIKQIAAMAMACCMAVFLCSCGADSENSESGTEVQSSDIPSLEEIYAANTLSAYQEANIQPSFMTCLREGEDNEETNTLLTIYNDEELGLVSRLRGKNSSFRYYFNKDDTDYYCELEADGTVSFAIVLDGTEDSDDGLTAAEKLFEENSFGVYHTDDEEIVSCTDNGDTYHIVTDVSDASYTDSDGQTYTYHTQEYDVEKDTLRILDVFRTYSVTDSDGITTECTVSLCMTYIRDLVTLPTAVEEMKDNAWDREITLISDSGTETVYVPNHLPLAIDLPDGYTAYTDSGHTHVYTTESAAEGITYSDRIVYIAED